MSCESSGECQQMFEKLEDYLDGEVSQEDVVLIREHLDKCGTCAGEYQFEASVLQSVREKLNEVDLPNDLLSRLRSTLRRAENN